MDAEGLRKQCLSFAGAEETFPFGERTSVFKVGGKMFALSQLDVEDLRVSLKCEPRLAENLRAVHPEVLPGYHLNKRHWNTVIVGGAARRRSHPGHDRGLLRPRGQQAAGGRAASTRVERRG